MINLEEDEHYFKWYTYACTQQGCNFETTREQDMQGHYVRHHPKKIQDQINANLKAYGNRGKNSKMVDTRS